MAFEKKTWSDRESEFPTRRILTPTGSPDEVDVTRAEGLVTNDGVPFNATTMNDLEGRISTGVTEAYNKAIEIPRRVFSSIDSIGVGTGILSENTGGMNAAFGSYAMKSNTSGRLSTAIGHESMTAQTTGGYNTAVGARSLNKNTTGEFNTSIGINSLTANTTGIYNTAVGGNALQTNTSGNYNTAVGNSAGMASGLGFSNSTAIGYSAPTHASNEITLGNTAISLLRCQVTTITSLSDRRIKEDIQPANIDMCLETVNALSVTRYKYKDFTGTHLDTHVTGWLADDVEEVFPKAVQANDETFNELDKYGDIVYENVDGEKRPKTFKMEKVKNITMTEALPTLWGAVQALSAQVEELKYELNQLKQPRY